MYSFQSCTSVNIIYFYIIEMSGSHWSSSVNIVMVPQVNKLQQSSIDQMHVALMQAVDIHWIATIKLTLFLQITVK